MKSEVKKSVAVGGWSKATDRRHLFNGIYILASRRNGTLYIGVTSDLIKRIWEHKNKLVEGFTEKYGVDKLVYYEQFKDAEHAIRREKRLKKYNCKWKIALIEKLNPNWRDLYEELTSGFPEQVGE